MKEYKIVCGRNKTAHTGCIVISVWLKATAWDKSEDFKIRLSGDGLLPPCKPMHQFVNRVGLMAVNDGRNTRTLVRQFCQLACMLKPLAIRHANFPYSNIGLLAECVPGLEILRIRDLEATGMEALAMRNTIRESDMFPSLCALSTRYSRPDYVEMPFRERNGLCWTPTKHYLLTQKSAWCTNKPETIIAFLAVFTARIAPSAHPYMFERIARRVFLYM
jgi:hypothetical protein